MIAIAKGADGDFKGLPHRVQSVFHHFRLVADGEPVRVHDREI